MTPPPLRQRITARVLKLAEALRRRPPPKVERALYVVAAILFVVGGVVAALRLDLRLDDLRWAPLLLSLLVGVPLTVLINAAEYRVSARILGHAIGMWNSLHVSVLATAAGMLPLPGSTLVRIRGLRQEGSRYGRATAVTIGIGLGWVGVSALIAGGWFLWAGRGAPAVAFGAGGFTACGLMVLLFWKSASGAGDLMRKSTMAVLVEIASVAAGAFRLLLAVRILGGPGTLGQGIVLSTSTAFAYAMGIFPGGLGIREIIAAGLAPLVGLSPAAGFAATALNRVIGLIGHAPVTAALIRRRAPGRRTPSADPGDGPDPRRSGSPLDESR